MTLTCRGPECGDPTPLSSFRTGLWPLMILPARAAGGSVPADLRPDRPDKLQGLGAREVAIAQGGVEPPVESPTALAAMRKRSF